MSRLWGYSMAKFRKLPVVIEAMQFTEASKDMVFNFVTCTRYPSWDAEGNPTLTFGTLNGDMTAILGDWIIKDMQGDFRLCTDEIFRSTYELVE